MKVKVVINESNNIFAFTPETEMEEMIIEALERDLKNLQARVYATTSSAYGVKSNHELSITLLKMEEKNAIPQYRNA